MITLITGAPGSGKSALLVSMLLERAPGPVFVSGIENLTLPHEELPPPSEWTVDAVEESTGALEPRYAFPPGSLLIVDECQRIFRPRSASSVVPPYVSALERHRHEGIDLWLVSQDPRLIDVNVRRLVGRHIHLRVTWAGRQLLEWPEVNNPDDKSSRAAALRRPFRLPKRVFTLYKSASLHVKQKRRLPWQLAVFGMCLLGAAFTAWHVYQRRVAHPVESMTPAPGGTQSTPVPGSATTGVVASVLGTSAADYEPRLRDRPETAPLYDAVRVVVAMPRVSGCMSLGPDDCTCTTQQGTDARVTVAYCEAFVRRGIFDPYRKDEIPDSPGAAGVGPSQSPDRAPMVANATLPP